MLEQIRQLIGFRAKLIGGQTDPVTLVKRLSHAHRERLFVSQFLFTESHRPARYHKTLSTFVLQLGHLKHNG